MPTGIVRWFDPPSGEGLVARGSREFPVHATDMEPAARLQGARVHFDVKRDEGVSRAVNVRLRAGTRTGHRHHRVGDRAGAHHPYTRGMPWTRKQREATAPTESRPARIAQEWATALRNRDTQSALDLYALDVVIHTGPESVYGHRAAGRWIETSDLVCPDTRRVSFRGGEDDTITVVGEAPGSAEPAEIVLRIARGRIVEQWNP